MAVIFNHYSSTSLLFHNFPTQKRTKTSSFRMDLQHQNDQGRKNFMEFPYVSDPHKSLMIDLVSTVEINLGSRLLPCTLPHDVQSYKNQSETAHASLHIRSGIESSNIDFVLGSWIHCTLPTGSALDITSLSAYLNSSTDAPNFLFELIRSGPTSLTLILDLPPRKDLVTSPEYLKEFYEDTGLERQRQLLDKLPEVKPYFSSSLYIRTVVSPTAIMVRIEAEEAARVDEIVEEHVGPVAKEVLRVWLDKCGCVEREVGEAERERLRWRDSLVKSKTIEVDLSSSLPRLFGEETAERVMAAVGSYFSS